MTDRTEYIENPQVIDVTYPDGETEPKFIVEAKAYAPRVKIRNDVFPRPWELYNCTTCKRGKELPANGMSAEDYHIYCKWDMKTHIGLKEHSSECIHKKWERKIERPKGGLWPGIETGPYAPDDRK